MTAVTAQALQ